MQPLRKEKLTMLALGLAGGRPLTKVQLQKAVFLFQEQLPESILPTHRLQRYQFDKLHFGAFCKDVYKDAYTLSEQGLVVATPDSPIHFDAVAANDHIGHHLSSILRGMPFEIYVQAQRIVDWVLQQGFEDLVSEVYSQYPEYKERSVLRRLRASIEAGINTFTASRFPEMVPDLVTAGYIVRDRLNAQRFLRDHAFLMPLLHEAIKRIETYFPEASVKLEVFQDPESEEVSEHLFVQIGTGLEPRDALNKLRQLQSDWWLARLPQARGKMTIGLDYL